MNVIKIKSLISAALALIMTVGIFAAIPAPAAAESYTPKPIPLKFTKEGAPDGYDGITVGKVYEHAYYTIDMDFLLDGFSAEDFFKNYTTQCDLKLRFIDDDAIWLHSDAKASYSLIDGYWTKEYPYITYWFEDTPKEESFWHCYCDIMHFTGPFTVPQVTVKFNLHDETPRFEYSLALYIEDHKTGLTVFSKRIRINLCDDSYKISELEIHDFDFQQKHGSLLQRDTTDVWCDVGNVVSIRYLEEDKKTEYTETAARAGMKGWVEFTISKGQNGCSFASEVQAKLFAGGYTGESVDVTTASDGSWCKAYFHFSISDDDNYVITQGTIGLTAPKAGAKANKDVETSNVKKIVRRGPTGAVTSNPQFTADKAAWFYIDKRGTMKFVDSFAAGNTYHALVKLTPDGNYYFNADSVAALQVPGADSFNIGYMKAGDVNGFVKEDGWYLLANFSVKNGSTPDTTPITTPVTTPPVTEPRTPMSLLPVGAQNIVVNDTATDFSFEVMAQNATGNVRYMWQACDSNGNVSDPTELSNGQAFLHHGMSMADNGKTQYYKCTAISGSDIASLVFSVRLEIKYFSLTIGYNKTDLTVEQGDSADVTAQTNIDPTLVSDLVVEWYRADNADGKNEKKLTSAKTTTLTVPTDTTGTAYYRCNVSCIWDGEYSRTVYTSSKYVKVTVNAKAAVTTPPPAVTTAPPAVTTAPPAVTTAPPAVTTAPPAITTAPPEVTTAPTEVTTAPPAVTTAPTEVTTAPAEITTAHADVTTSPEESKTVGGDVTTAPTPGDSDSSSATVWIIVGVAVAVLAAAAVAVVLIMKKKRK